MVMDRIFTSYPESKMGGLKKNKEEIFEEGSILVKVKEGENFSQRSHHNDSN